MTKAIEIALFLHLLGVAVWVGGMVFAHFCLRPALGDLSPQLRLPLWESVFGRFFNWVGVSVLVILVSGGFLLSQYGGSYKVRDAMVYGFWMTPFLKKLFEDYIANNGGNPRALMAALNR